MIDCHEIVAQTVRSETRNSRVHDAGFRVQPLGRQVIQRTFLTNHDARVEVGVLSQPKGRRGKVDHNNSAIYVTDHSVVPPVTHWLVDTPLGRYAQTTQRAERRGFLVGEETIVPLTPIAEEAASRIAGAMLELLDGVEEPSRSLEYPNSWQVVTLPAKGK